MKKLLYLLILFSIMTATNGWLDAAVKEAGFPPDTAVSTPDAENAGAAAQAIRKKIQIPPARESYLALKGRIIRKYEKIIPHQWGEKVTGVKTVMDTNQKVIALTLDACGGKKGKGYDSRLIQYLEKENVPASLFISGRWIDDNRNIFSRLIKNPLFEIENHGLNHRPCSVNGRLVYGIQGTESAAVLIDEIEKNGMKIEILTGRKPRYYRPGTAYCDEIGVQVAGTLGYEVVNFNVLGDAGATYNRKEVAAALLSAPPGSIVILHMNHPEAETAAGLMDAVPEMKKKGFRFVKLSEFSLK
jgi:peptidoglycan/xylan/chitin deacetylase (PgdA/CDA1 family)